MIRLLGGKVDRKSHKPIDHFHILMILDLRSNYTVIQPHPTCIVPSLVFSHNINLLYSHPCGYAGVKEMRSFKTLFAGESSQTKKS